MIGPSKIALAKSKRQQLGFTLIEMIIVCAIISILLGVMVPVYKIHILHANEAVLKQDLRSMRDAIDQFTQDKSKAPQDLNDLVTAGYLHAIPKDPFTNKADTWQTVQEDVLTSIDQTAPGITDVKSGSSLISSEGTAYSSW
ncbi:MAG TPA: prepilin-type N-terminal cleavage/methylation domain-containing protein [Candidatus Angelobacter sp.]|jgi:general secretion pathway protein G|nr:prepilin-type N-terminal cleavage/methylation domain-containing protein [Candidatus Angelobacter sp.]